MSNNIEFNFLKVLKSVYVGNFISFFTPDRIGTFIGRFLVLKNNKLLITATTGLGNLAQLASTLLFMIFALFIYAYKYNFILISQEYLILLIVLYLVILAVILLIYIKPSFALKKLSKIKLIKKYALRLLILDNISFIIKIKVLVLSILRYIIFCFQYYILILLFNLEISIVDLLVFIGLLYGFVTFIPSPFFGNLGTREAVALSITSVSGMGIVAPIISLIVWFVNVGFSSLIGGIIFSMTIKKNKC